MDTTPPLTPPVVVVVIPCYKVRAHVLGVLAAIGSEVDRIFCVDDACPEGAGDFIQQHCKDPRVRVLFNSVNRGVGGAVIAGYRAALEIGATVVVKVDGDGQMDPRLIARFIAPILDDTADYTKGNRFYNLADVQRMPGFRVLGNAGLSFLTKLSSGYWHVFDPTNGYTAIHGAVLRELPLERLAERYFFESDILHRLYLARAVVVDVPMRSVYGEEVSNLRISRVLLPFLWSNLRNTARRLLYCYFLRDFTAASLEMLVGVPLVAFGMVFGAVAWLASINSGVPATAGTVMTAAFPIMTGVQLLLAAIGHDISAVPRVPMHPILESRRSHRLSHGEV